MSDPRESDDEHADRILGAPGVAEDVQAALDEYETLRACEEARRAA